MKIEIGKVTSDLQFCLSFGVLPSNPQAEQIATERINNLVKYAESMSGVVEATEERLIVWNRIHHLTETAQKAGYFKNKD